MWCLKTDRQLWRPASPASREMSLRFSTATSSVGIFFDFKLSTCLIGYCFEIHSLILMLSQVSTEQISEGRTAVDPNFTSTPERPRHARSSSVTGRRSARLLSPQAARLSTSPGRSRASNSPANVKPWVNNKRLHASASENPLLDRYARHSDFSNKQRVFSSLGKIFGRSLRFSVFLWRAKLFRCIFNFLSIECNVARRNLANVRVGLL